MADLLINQSEFDAARDTCKQVLTLSTAIVTITVTFLTSVIKQAAPSTRLWIHLSWLGFALAVLFGVWTLLALSGSVATRTERTSRKSGDARGNATAGAAASAAPSIYSANVRMPALLQMVCFVAALVCTIVFGWYALSA
ncbi:MAG: hypothetical protein M0004_01505 [Actinomycetota bacterium]|nr:hypothetical protein [Actinomycetota bacterium]